MVKRGTLNRDVTKQECSWLEYDLLKGEQVFEYKGNVFSFIHDGGVAVCLWPSQPFFEVPKDSVDWR